MALYLSKEARRSQRPLQMEASWTRPVLFLGNNRYSSEGLVPDFCLARGWVDQSDLFF